MHIYVNILIYPFLFFFAWGMGAMISAYGALPLYPYFAFSLLFIFRNLRRLKTALAVLIAFLFQPVIWSVVKLGLVRVLPPGEDIDE